jgi:hypothetical protein
MTQQVITPIVEGHSEVQSVPVLLRRILGTLNIYNICIARPYRVKRQKITKEGELERVIQLALQDPPGVAAIIVLLDADDDCPKVLGSSLLARAEKTTSLPVAVVIANRELEGWFLGAKESLRGIRGIKEDARPPENPEAIRGAKEHLESNMSGSRKYMETDDQPALAAQMDLELAISRCPSFCKFFREVQRLAEAMSPVENMP